MANLLKNKSYVPEKTEPTVLDFFGRFSSLLTPLNLAQRMLGMASGVLSGIVVAYILYTQLPPTVPTQVMYVACIAAFVLGYIIFDGFYIYIAETVFRMVRDGSVKQSGSMAFMCLMLTAVGAVIGYIDFINSTKAGEILGGKTAERPPLQQTDSLLTRQISQAQMLTTGSSTQVGIIAESVKNKIEAKENEYKGKIEDKEAGKKRFAALAAEGNQWAKGEIAKIDKSISGLKSKKSNEISGIQNEAAKKIQEAGKNTDDMLDRLTKENAESVSVLNEYNKVRLEQYQNEYNQFAALGWLITAFLSIAPTLVTLLKVLIEVGSGIAITTQTRRRGLAAILTHHWQSLKEWFYDLIDPMGRLNEEEEDDENDAQQTQHQTQHTHTAHEHEDDNETSAPIATNYTGKQPTIGYLVPKDGFSKTDKTQQKQAFDPADLSDDCRNCAVPPAEPQENTVITAPKTVITTSKTAAYIADIARISAAIKASMSKLRSNTGKPQSTTARIIYLSEKLQEAADTNKPVAVEKSTPATYKQKTAHINTATDGLAYLQKNHAQVLEAIGEKG